MTAQLAMIDVSANNHLADEPIDWLKVAEAGYRAVMIKATEGHDYVNPWLRQDAEAAKVAGFLVGYYHFAHPGDDLPASEANHAVDAIAGLPRDLGLALDLEVSEGRTWPALAAYAKAFHVVVRQTVDHCPLYVDDDFLDNLPGAPWGWRLWVAQTARPRREVWAWQMTSPANVLGIQVPTDVGWLHPVD